MDMQVIRDQPRQVPKTFRGEFPRNLLCDVAEVVAVYVDMDTVAGSA